MKEGAQLCEMVRERECCHCEREREMVHACGRQRKSAQWDRDRRRERKDVYMFVLKKINEHTERGSKYLREKQRI